MSGEPRGVLIRAGACLMGPARAFTLLRACVPSCRFPTVDGWGPSRLRVLRVSSPTLRRRLRCGGGQMLSVKNRHGVEGPGCLPDGSGEAERIAVTDVPE